MAKHVWKFHIEYVPGEPLEQFTACETCGIELDDENENEECEGWL